VTGAVAIAFINTHVFYKISFLLNFSVPRVIPKKENLQILPLRKIAPKELIVGKE